MNSLPTVSVVIPTFDRLGFVTEAVESVLGQTFRDLELLVVDDGSTDDTAEALGRRYDDPRLRVIRQENLGVSAARNRGAAEASGRWLAFLDSDDTWLPEKLDRQLAALTAHPDHPACYTEEVWYRDGRWANPCDHHAKPTGRIFEPCLALCLISPSSIVLDRGVFENLSGFDESLPACEDYDLWLRLTARHPVWLVNEKLIVKRNGHPGQLSRAHWGLDRFRVRALWKVVYDPVLPDRLRRLALAALARKAAVVAQGARKRGADPRARVFDHSRLEAAAWLDRLDGAPSPSTT